MSWPPPTTVVIEGIGPAGDCPLMLSIPTVIVAPPSVAGGAGGAIGGLMPPCCIIGGVIVNDSSVLVSSLISKVFGFHVMTCISPPKWSRMDCGSVITRLGASTGVALSFVMSCLMSASIIGVIAF